MKKLIVFFAALSCAVSLSAQVKQTAVVAHRGYWKCEAAGYSQNSVAALKAAQDLGFWGSEFDVNMTADEVVLVNHDPNIQGVSINDNNYEAFKEMRLPNGEPIPTIDDYIEQAKKNTNTVLVLEVKWHKTPEMEDRCCEICIDKLKAAGLFKPKNVIFISFSMHACETLLKMAPGFTVQYLGSDLKPEEAVKHGVNGMDTNYWTVFNNDYWVPQTREHGMSLNLWTVDNAEHIRKCFGYGIDQITTNEPESARAILKEMGIKEQVNGCKNRRIVKRSK